MEYQHLTLPRGTYLMTTFDKRERAFENLFMREQEASFIVNMKACSLLARWVAEEKIGLNKRAADRYCGKIIALSVKDCNPQTLFAYMQQRLKKHKVEVSDRELEYQYFKAIQAASVTG